VHDLAAMTAMQYDHAGLSPLWPVLETALLRTRWRGLAGRAPEPLVHYSGGEARIALFEPRAWKPATPPTRRAVRTSAARSWNASTSISRRGSDQIAAVLGAHGIPVNFVHAIAGGRRVLD
jgi:hypothetical protein